MVRGIYCARSFALPNIDRLRDRQGFSELIPKEEFAVFTTEEAMLLLNGNPEVDVSLMKSCTEYKGGFDKLSPVVLVRCYAHTHI